MKVLFICGCLEPNCNGVGDYVRRLAIELIQQGHQIATVAISDPYITTKFEGTQLQSGIELPVLRIPATLPHKQRFSLVKSLIISFNPEWLSLQFVPFSFHEKGLPFKLGKQLMHLGQGRRWHIMFHELWVGIGKDSSKKLFYWGKLQRYLIKSLISNLHPHVIHTQTQLYKTLLCMMGFNVKVLPLFSNIQNATQFPTTPEMRQNPKRDCGKVSLVIFGSIHPGAPVEELAKEASLFAKKRGLEISLTFVGRSGKEESFWTHVWKSAGVTVKLLGEQPAEHISEIISNASLGLSTTSAAVIEKSGSVAAMLDHGIPVLCVAKPWLPRGVTGLKLPPGIYEYTIGNFEACINNNNNFLFNNNVFKIAQQFEGDLSTAI